MRIFSFGGVSCRRGRFAGDTCDDQTRMRAIYISMNNCKVARKYSMTFWQKRRKGVGVRVPTVNVFIISMKKFRNNLISSDLIKFYFEKIIAKNYLITVFFSY